MTKNDAPRATILVVDDEEGVRKVCARTLGQAGYEVLLAGGGAEAISLLETHAGPVHMALVDVAMPEMPGPEVARQLRARSRRTKILFMSGYESGKTGENGVMDPDAHFLGKPFSGDVLLRKVRDLLARPLPSRG